MAYPLPSSINASEGISGVSNYLCTVTSCWFFYMLLLAVYLITVIGIYKTTNDIAQGIAVAGFFTFVVALLLWIGNVIPGFALGITIAVAIIGVLIIYMSNK